MVNLFNYVNLRSANSINSTYALGNTRLLLTDSKEGTVKLFKDAYNWDYHKTPEGGKQISKRNFLIFVERKRAGVNNEHGFQLLFYGTGHLKHNKE